MLDGIERLTPSNHLDLEVSDLPSPFDKETEEKMDQNRVNQLDIEHQAIVDEMNDLRPADVTKETAPLLKLELTKIWEMKNAFRNGVRQLVSVLQSEDPARGKRENYSEDLVDKVIKHKLKMLAAIEKVCPTEQMTEFQKKSLELQEKTLQEEQE